MCRPIHSEHPTRTDPAIQSSQFARCLGYVHKAVILHGAYRLTFLHLLFDHENVDKNTKNKTTEGPNANKMCPCRL